MTTRAANEKVQLQQSRGLRAPMAVACDRNPVSASITHSNLGATSDFRLPRFGGLIEIQLSSCAHGGDGTQPDPRTREGGVTHNPTFATALLTHRPRESSGSSTANRFAYQRTWALCHLLELHERPDDYMLVMEFHDDVIVLDSATCPTAADFFQLKTLADKTWRLTSLLNPSTKKTKKKGKSASNSVPSKQTEPASVSSILGKLVEHTVRFGLQYVRTMNLVSNAKFDLEVASKLSRSSVSLHNEKGR